MNKKYKIDKETGRIRALKSFANVTKGDLGGFVDSEKNLSHDGDAWVSGDARVFGDARVSGNAWVSGDARVYGDARVSGNAWVSGDARLESPTDLVYLRGTVHSITACRDLVSIGCVQHTLGHWLANYESIGIQHAYTQDQLEEYSVLLQALTLIIYSRKAA